MTNLAIGQIKARLGRVKLDSCYKQRGLRMIRDALAAHKRGDETEFLRLYSESARMLEYAVVYENDRI